MKKAVLLIIALLLALWLHPFTQADFGGFSGDTDYGGGGWDSGSGYGSNDYDYSSNGWGSDFGFLLGSGGSDESPLWAYAVVIILFVLFIRSRMRRGKSTRTPARSGPPPAGATPTPASQLLPLTELIKADPNLNESVLCERISDLYVRFQKAWQQKDLAPVRPHLSERFFAQVNRQLQDDYVAKGLTSYLDKIAVLEVRILGYRTNPEQDELVAYLRTRFINYTRDDATGAVVRGSTSQEVFMEYEWTLVRKRGVLTRPGSSTPEVNCPNCGATVDLSLSSKCAFCGTVLDTAENDWVVSGIRGLSQRGRQ